MTSLVPVSDVAIQTDCSGSLSSLERRRFLTTSAAGVAAMALPAALLAAGSESASRHTLGDSELLVVSDGYFQIPLNVLVPESATSKEEREAFLTANNLSDETFKPDCNITLWRSGEKLVLFDTGSGSQFVATAGKLLDGLAESGIEATDITDVVFTHAHPDHMWGLIDDFDELTFPEAAYHMSATEWNYWLADSTIDTIPGNRKTFVVGAQNRFPLIEERVQLFSAGDEVLPGVEAVDTQGHTPGHTSFALHQGTDSILVVGDALAHSVVSFEKPNWPSGTDQDPETAKATRLKLLDRLAHEQSRIVGFHLPYPGLGRVERKDSYYQFALVD
ncbi:MAG: MBL fold metallo-hydrolase [Granulosicoccus sp.]